MSRVDHLFPDTVVFAPLLGRTDAGDPEIGEQCTTKGRIEDDVTMKIDPDGNERQSNHKIVTKVKVPRTAFVWLCPREGDQDDIEDTNAARRPITVKRASMPDGSLSLFETWL
jgi:hypothetical protein